MKIGSADERGLDKARDNPRNGPREGKEWQGMAILNSQPRIAKRAAKLASLAALACACGSAQADTIWYMTHLFDQASSGTVLPTGYMKAVLHQVDANNVSLTLENVWSSSSAQKTTEFSFNVNTAFAAAGQSLAITNTGGQAPTDPSGPLVAINRSASHAQGDSFKADGDGYFDVMIVFAQSGASQFTGMETSSYNISKAGLLVSDFLFTSQYSTGGYGGYLAGAHIQGIAPPGTSAWMSPGPLVIPLPSGAALAGMGLFVVPVIRRRPIAG